MNLPARTCRTMRRCRTSRSMVIRRGSVPASRTADDGLAAHGGLSNSDVMLDVIGAELAASHRVAAFGPVGRVEPRHVRTLSLLIDGRRRISPSSNTSDTGRIWLGWSDGGIVGLLVALRRPRPGRTGWCSSALNYHFARHPAHERRWVGRSVVHHDRGQLRRTFAITSARSWRRGSSCSHPSRRSPPIWRSSPRPRWSWSATTT